MKTESEGRPSPILMVPPSSTTSYLATEKDNPVTTATTVTTSATPHLDALTDRINSDHTLPHWVGCIAATACLKLSELLCDALDDDLDPAERSLIQWVLAKLDAALAGVDAKAPDLDDAGCRLCEIGGIPHNNCHTAEEQDRP